jgi:hypothetical protein
MPRFGMTAGKQRIPATSHNEHATEVSNMVSLVALWLPILLSAVFVFIVSNILWMALPFWHRRDYDKLPDEPAALAMLGKVKAGLYIVPCVDWNKASAEEREELHKGPMGLLILRNPVSSFSFGKAIASYFLYMLVISFLIAYLCAHVLPAGAHYLKVFRVAGTAGILAYSFGGFPYTIWYGKPWSVTFKDVIDGVIYGLLIAGTFGWLWPK